MFGGDTVECFWAVNLLGNHVNKFGTLSCVLDVVCVSGHVSGHLLFLRTCDRLTCAVLGLRAFR